MPLRRLTVPDFPPKKLDAWLAKEVPGLSIERARAWLIEGRVRIDGKKAKPGRKLWGREQVEIDEPEARAVPRVEGPPVEVLFEDARLFVVNKAPGMVVEPDGHNPSLVELLATQRPGSSCGGVAAPGVVHRIDKETSGCVMLAKTDDAVRALEDAFERKQVEKRYLALVLGAPPDTGQLDTPYGRDPKNPRLFSSKVSSPRRARLSWTVKERFADAALVEVMLDTGRTHQIRVQLTDQGFPLLGDPVYGGAPTRQHPVAQALGRLALHAASLRLDATPGFQVEAPLPEDLRRALQTLRDGGMSRGP